MSEWTDAIERTAALVNRAICRQARFESYLEKLREQPRPCVEAIREVLDDPQAHRAAKQRAIVHLTLSRSAEARQLLQQLAQWSFDDEEVRAFVLLGRAYCQLISRQREVLLA